MRYILIVAIVGCSGGRPTATGTPCPNPDPMTYGYTAADTPGCTGSAGDCNFGKTFMDTYCINCHDSSLRNSMRNGAPLFHDFDTLLGVLEVPDHIDQQAGFGPKAQNTFMPSGGTNGQCPSTLGGKLDEACPEPTVEERTKLAQWLACERGRTHNFTDAGVD